MKIWIIQHQPDSFSVQCFETDRRLKTVEVASLAELTGVGEEDLIVGLVPTREVLLTSIELPKMQASELKKALPYALEEQLTTELDSSHFVWAKTDEPQRYAVAVVGQARLASWIELYKQAGLKLDALVPDVYQLPVLEQGWSLMQRGEAVLCREDRWLGAEMPLDHLAVFLQAKYQDRPVEKIQVLDSDELALPTLGEVEVEHVAAVTTPWVLDVDQLPLNLLAGKVKLRRKIGQQKKRWRRCVYLFIFIVLVFLGVRIGEFYFFRYQNQLLQRLTQSVVNKIYPGVTLNNPKERLQQAMKSLQKRTGGGEFSKLFRDVGEVLSTRRAVELQAFSYAKGKLMVTVKAPDIQHLHHFASQLAGMDLSVKPGKPEKQARLIQQTFTVRQAK